MREKLSTFRDTLSRTRRATFGRVATLFGATEITSGLWDDLEAMLIQADIGVGTTVKLLDRLQARVSAEGILQADKLLDILKEELRGLLNILADEPPIEVAPLRVVLVVGTNGSGKTTTIAKLAARYKKAGQKVLIVAADTFRAAAGEQLQIWAKRVGVELVGGQPGADPGAVTFDAMEAAKARGVDVVLVDTAGRLHTKYNLMQELIKVRKVIGKALHGAPHETILILDGTTGQNALVQAQQYQEAVDIDGVIITKLDGTARGGIVFAVMHELRLPIRFIGTGENIGDIVPFDADAFVHGLFE